MGDRVDLIRHWQLLADVGAAELETLIHQQMRDVRQSAGGQVIHADDLVLPIQQGLAEVGAEKTGTTSDNNSHEYIPMAAPPTVRYSWTSRSRH
jgi:hypothetical protein